MNVEKIPRYVGACLRALLTRGPRAYLKLLAKSPYTVKELGDISMIVDVRDPAISKPILVLGEYEPTFTRVFQSLIQEDTRLLDVGANIGFFTLLAAERAVDGGVWSVEPDPVNVRVLRANVAFNGFEDRVEVVHAAASDAEGEVFLSSLGNEANIGARFTAKDQDTLMAHAAAGAGAPTRVRSLTVDALVGAQQVDLVKVDVEGHEPSVFAGMQRVLTECRPVVLSEFAPGTIRHISQVEPADYLRQIASHGYVFAVIESSGEVSPMGDATESVLSAFAADGGHHIDLMMIPKEKEEQTLKTIGRAG